VAAGTLVLGVAAGFLWSAVTPRPLLVMTGRGAAQVVNAETNAFIAADGWYCIICLACGVLTGLAGYLIAVRRYGPVAMLAVLASALAAAWITLWTGEHIIIPVDIADPFRYGVPLPKNYKHMPDPFTNMAAASAVTTKLKYGLDVCLITQRELLVFAKEAATLDRISEGRLILGMGYGWIKEESEIFGVEWSSRVRRSSEAMRVLQTIWSQEEPSFSGEFYNFPKIHSNPKPYRNGNVPMLIGSGGTGLDNGRALGRVAELADGWAPTA